MIDQEKVKETKVTVEDLLQLKRKEIPSGDFWDSFDASLRQKSIKALVRETPRRRHLIPVALKWGVGALSASTVTMLSFSYVVSHQKVEVAPAEVLVQTPVSVKSTTPFAANATQEPTFNTVPSHASFVVDVLNPLSDQTKYKTIQTAQKLTLNNSGKTRYLGDVVPAASFKSVLASTPSFDHF